MTQNIYQLSKSINFSFLERDWTILRADMEVLWEQMVQTSELNEKTSLWQNDERLPYYAELWGSSLALGNWLSQIKNDIQNKICLDLGCGLGFTALCARHLGAKVLGIDYEEKAILLSEANAKANGFTLQKDEFDFLVMDWREPKVSPNSFDFIWAADIIYERSFINPVLDFLEYALKPQGKVYIAEPNRSIFNDFPPELKKRKLEMTKVYFEKTMLIEPFLAPASVTIWEIKNK